MASGASKKKDDDDVESALRQQLSVAWTALNKRRWSTLTPEQRSRATKPAVKASLASRAKDPPKVRSARASKAASSISPAAAQARAMKAWETKRRKREAAAKRQTA